MKIKIIPCILWTWIGIFNCPGHAYAQFFKDILNTVKNTAQSRANNKASQTTNQTLDKVDNSTQPGSHSANSNTAPADSSATHSVLGAFAKAAAENPNDTSSADLTMKALGILAGNGGVSAQDSAKAIDSYKTASGGSGIHYEYVMTIRGKNTTNKDSSQLYITKDGEGRSEKRIPMPGVQMNKMIILGRFNSPRYSILLYPESNSYSLNIIDTAMLKDREKYQVTRIGTETVQGYSCVHSKIISTIGSGMYTSTSTIDIWTSTGVPGSALYTKMAGIQTSQTGMMRALENAGGGGVFVKMVVTGKDYTVEEDLIKAEEGHFSADMFRIPSGYTESAGNMFSHMIPPSKK
jgi:Domain of unknown function (DUF4412)